MLPGLRLIKGAGCNQGLQAADIHGPAAAPGTGQQLHMLPKCPSATSMKPNTKTLTCAEPWRCATYVMSGHEAGCITWQTLAIMGHIAYC